jgi:hypothetical protein
MPVLRVPSAKPKRRPVRNAISKGARSVARVVYKGVVPRKTRLRLSIKNLNKQILAAEREVARAKAEVKDTLEGRKNEGLHPQMRTTLVKDIYGPKVKAAEKRRDELYDKRKKAELELEGGPRGDVGG